MATTRAQELNTLIVDTHQNQEDIKTINANISSINLAIEILKEQCFYIKDLKDFKSTFEHSMGHSQNPSSSKQPSYQDDHDSSHYQGPHTTNFSRDLRPPKIEVNKFDGSNPTGWVTQMEHYFSSHGITDDLAKLHYGVLHLDTERWQWWQWRKKAHQGYVAWTQFVAKLYDNFDSHTHHLGRLAKLKQYGTVEDFIVTFEHLAFIIEGMSDDFFKE
jgi:hypothetical protein